MFGDHVSMLRLAGKPPTVQFVDENRTLSQNDLIYQLYRQISTNVDDDSFADIRRECKLRYGIPILRSIDPEFGAIYDKSIKHGLDYEKKLILMDFIDVTSKFKKAQASEYIDTIIREYSKRGISLTNPSENSSYDR